jgi:4-hydroxy-tetrahydrodipicolinate reductase
MIRVIVIGLGPIGIGAAKAILADRDLQLVGLVDVDPAKVGKTLTEIGAGVQGGPKISASIAEGATHGAGVAIVTTTSKFDQIVPTLRELMGHQIHVVSSCEEMSWPAYLHPELAKQIDDEAKRAGVALLGTGVNPGFIMDYLPVVLSSMVTRVTGARVGRYVDASTRRLPLQAKVGATMTVEYFNALARDGKIGHMGIAESVAMLAAGLGREVKKGDVKVTLDPVVASREMSSLLGTITEGQVCGMRNTANWSGDGLTIDMELVMALGTKEPHDLIELDGPVPLRLRIEGGTPGDSATVASLVNFTRVLPRCTPGLKTMLDVPVGGAQAKT